MMAEHTCFKPMATLQQTGSTAAQHILNNLDAQDPNQFVADHTAIQQCMELPWPGLPWHIQAVRNQEAAVVVAEAQTASGEFRTLMARMVRMDDPHSSMWDAILCILQNLAPLMPAQMSIPNNAREQLG